MITASLENNNSTRVNQAATVEQGVKAGDAVSPTLPDHIGIQRLAIDDQQTAAPSHTHAPKIELPRENFHCLASCATISTVTYLMPSMQESFEPTLAIALTTYLQRSRASIVRSTVRLKSISTSITSSSLSIPSCRAKTRRFRCLFLL